MSYLKINENLQLESQELNRFVKFLVEDNLNLKILQNSYKFGIFDNLLKDSTFANFKVESGTNIGTIKIAQDSYAINKLGNIIYKPFQDNIGLISNSNWYWIKISHLFSPIEKGKISIDVNGNMTGIGTEFTKVLRGRPNFPSKIRFYGSGLNTREYEVTDVLNDTTVTLSGIFTNETGLEYSVIGTFTPGIAVPSPNKEIFQYDSCQISIIAEQNFNTPPPIINGEEFYIARVNSNGSTVIIEDKRTEIFQTKDYYNQRYINKTLNKLVGVESVKWDNLFTPKDKNEVNIAWAFRSSNWTLDTNLRRLTLNGGEGGLFKTSAQFTTGDFNGWRVYAKNGSYKIITDSVKSGSQINLTVHSLDKSDYNQFDELIIAPPVEEVQFLVTSDYDDGDGKIAQLEKIHTFSVNEGVGKFMVVVPSKVDPYLISVKWRYKRYEDYSQWLNLNPDLIGYYNESSFDTINGLLKPDAQDRVRVTAIPTGDDGGYIQLNPHPLSYSNFNDLIFLGDKLGVKRRNLDNAHPFIDLKVGVEEQYQFIEGSLVFTSNHIINLSNVGAKNGNKFFINFANTMDYNTSFDLTIVQNASVANPLGDTLFVINEFLRQQCIINNLMLRCEFDGTNWIVFKHLSIYQNQEQSGSVKYFSGVVSGNFDSTGLGIGEWYGWALCNGKNGSPDLRGRFIVGQGNTDVNNYGYVNNEKGKYLTLSGTGNASFRILVPANLPPHDHRFNYSREDVGATNSQAVVDTINNGGIPAYPGGNGITNLGPGTSEPFDIIPPYYVLAAVIKL